MDRLSRSIEVDVAWSDCMLEADASESWFETAFAYVDEKASIALIISSSRSHHPSDFFRRSNHIETQARSVSSSGGS